MRKAVIWGVTGQDGSYLAELLLSKDYKVVGVYRRTSTPNDGRVRTLLADTRFHLVAGDVTDPTSVFRVLDAVEPHEVYNLAAQSHVGVSFDEPRHTTDVTYLGCLNILEWLRARQKMSCRFYQASSSEMFGSSQTTSWSCNLDGSEAFDENVYQDEDTPMLPNSPYAVAKLAAHHLVRIYRESYDLFACSGILFNHESERRPEQFVTRKITRFVASLKNWEAGGRVCEPPRLRLGDVSARRDWGHAEDYVRAMWLMLGHERPDDYVVATGETHSVAGFLSQAFEVADLGDWRPHVDINCREFRRPCEVPYLLGDASRARAVLGWKPEVSFEALVRRMVLYDMRAPN